MKLQGTKTLRRLVSYSAHSFCPAKGSVLIMVLWIIMLGMILVTAIATNIRLSATTVVNHQQALYDWSGLLETIDKAHMEILIQKMAKVKVKETSAYQEKSNENVYDGRKLQLHYKTPEGMSVRIYDLAGKINVSRITEVKLKQLLEHLLGKYHKKIPQLVDAWFDWTDTNALKRLNGAEKEYYKKQKLSYVPRNGLFATVDEIRLVRGFDKVFEDVNLEEIFTLYGSANGVVNPNIASKQVLMMIPGIDEKIANDIISARELQAFKNLTELDIHLPLSVLAKAKTWFKINQSNYYSIAIYPTEFETSEKGKQTITAYIEEVRVLSNLTLPAVLRVLPQGEIIIN